MVGPPANKVRVGILGCSDIACRKFIPALQSSTGAVLRGIGSRDRRKPAAVNPGEKCELLGYEDLLAHPAIDLVYLSLPNHLHEEWTLRALQSGKHVICEKPLALSAASVERMLNCAGERRLLLYENLMYLHHPQHAAVKELIGSGEIGRVQALRSVFGFPFPAKGNFRLDPEKGGGAIHDLARYPLSTAQYFLRGDSYQFNGYALDRNGLNVALHGMALTSAGELFSFSLAFGQQYESHYEIIGERGKIRVERAYTTPAELENLVQVSCGERDASFTVPPCDHFRLMIEHVSALVQNAGDFREAHERSRRLARLAEQMERGCHHEQQRQ
jgi:dTDP-3,4-didehydro-2,6-dideoxy-alpha-D-glucose 3-reductase